MTTSAISEQSKEQTNSKRRSIIEAIFNQDNVQKFGSSDSLNAITREVHLIDDRCVTVEFTTKTLGSAVLREVCRYLNVLNSMNYFGIRFVNNSGLIEWLDLDKRFYKQVKDLTEKLLSLRVMFYPTNPLEQFKDVNSRRLFYLQLRRDFYIGRLRTNSHATYDLAAYAIQADHGLTEIPEGFDIINIPGGMRILPDIPEEVVRHICCRVKPLLGMSKEEAQDEFIRRACYVETYGMEPFQVMDQYDNGLCIGFNHKGISAFKNGERTDIFLWQNIKEVNRSGKHLVIVVPRGQCNVRLGFKAHSTTEAKMLLRRAVNCRNFSLKSIQKRESGVCTEEYVDDLNNYEINPQITLEYDSETSGASSEELPKQNLTAEKQKEVSQPSLRRFLEVPRLSLETSPSRHRVPINKSSAAMCKFRSGSVDLRNVVHLDVVPIIREGSNSSSRHNITCSSINVSGNSSQEKVSPA